MFQKLLFSTALCVAMTGCAEMQTSLATGAPSTTQNAQADEDASFLYRNCKETIGKKSFNKSPCKVAITSLMFGLSFTLQGTFPSERPTDPYKQGEWDTMQSILKQICFPPNFDPQEGAKQYIAYYESGARFNNLRENRPYYGSDKVHMTDVGEIILISLMLRGYKCE